MRRLSRLLLSLLVLVLGVSVAPAALAHDQLVSSDPADGTTVQESPERITLTYSSEPLDVGSLVVVTGPDGTELQRGEPTVDGLDATLDLEQPLPAGTSTVQWRVVSSDGHPIEGTLSVTVDGPTPSATATSAPAPTPSPTTAPEPAPAPSSGAPWLLIGVGALAVLAVGAGILLARRTMDR
ncbi:copper resistance protein CopC [Brachybacterium sp. EF45031]|uniref:copper resistance CopC family protein n=1 Tax=Brachybacterium sillae TaxID=2810536 RepID=UPI00255A312E|nr:copper resistance protein CopC [Brachybacterium sillae]MCS6711327.1 copper resistance protein CopC [Brachybacterium sillae]